MKVEMKVGDLIELQSGVQHVSGFLKPGALGIIIAIEEPQMIFENQPLATVQAMFGSEIVGCHRKELEVISANR